MFKELNNETGIIYAQISVLYEVSSIPLIVWDKKINFKKALNMNSIFIEHMITSLCSYEIYIQEDDVTLLAITSPTQLLDMSDIAQKFKLFDFKGQRAHNVSTMLLSSDNTKDIDIHKIMLTEQKDFNTVFVIALKHKNRLQIDQISSYMQLNIQNIGVKIQTMEVEKLIEQIDLELKLQNQNLELLKRKQIQFDFAQSEFSKPLAFQVTQPNFKQSSKKSMIKEWVENYEIQNASRKMKDQMEIEFYCEKEIQNENPNLYDTKRNEPLTVYNIGKIQLQNLQQLSLTHYTIPIFDSKLKQTNFITKQFTKSDVKKAIKYIQSPQVMEQILEELIIHKNLVIVGPAPCCNLLARSLSICLPISHNSILYCVENQHQQCIGSNSGDSQLYQIRKIESQQCERDFTLDKFESGNVKFNYFDTNHTIGSINLCKCGQLTHFQPLWNIAIQCLNGTLESLDIDQLLQLQIRPQIVNLLADNPEEVIQNFNFQKQEWTKLTHYLPDLKFIGAQYSLYHIYQKLFFPIFKLPKEKSYVLNSTSYQMQHIIANKFIDYLRHQLINSSILSQKQQVYQFQKSYKINHLDIYFSSNSQIMSINHQPDFYDWKFFEMMNDILRLQKIYNSMYNDTQLPYYTAVQLVTMVQALQYEIGV